jgi:hypothetical protein
MVNLTTLASAISMALLANTANAVPTPPPTSSALDFTLFTGQQPGHQNECWDNGKALHVAPADLGTCFKADIFYTARIYSQAYGYSCTRIFPFTLSFSKRLADDLHSLRLR